MKRNYLSKPKSATTPPPPVQLYKCPISKCNRKYKTEVKLKTHVEQRHYYDTRGGNPYFELTHSDRATIYNIAAEYTQVIYAIKNDTIPDIYASMLLPQYFNHEIPSHDMLRITQAHANFINNVFETQILDTCDWTKAMDDFEGFLKLGLPYYDSNFCPTLPVDFLWHSLMMRPELYTILCTNACGQVIPHCNEERSPEEDNARYEYFTDMFNHTYGRLPYIPPKRATDMADMNGHVSMFQTLAANERDQSLAKKRQKDLEYQEFVNAQERYHIQSSSVYRNRRQLGSSC